MPEFGQKWPKMAQKRQKSEKNTENVIFWK